MIHGAGNPQKDNCQSSSNELRASSRGFRMKPYPHAKEDERIWKESLSKGQSLSR